MFEETNQTALAPEETSLLQEGILPFNLFDEAEEEEEKITVKYNGEERDITVDEAKNLAQKGMNYDHIFSERESAHRALDALAAREGLSRAQLIKRASGEDLHDLLWRGLVEKYPELSAEDIPDAVFHSVAKGMRPIEAYQEHLIAKLRQELSSKESGRKTIGSLSGVGDEVRDEFLEGFLGEKY